MQTICTSLQTDNHVSIPAALNFYRPDALPDAQSQRCQSTEGESTEGVEMFSVNINGGYVQCIEHCCEYCPVAHVVTVPL